MRAADDRAETVCRRLEQLWDVGQRPDVGGLLAEAGVSDAAGVARVLALDQWRRWQAGERVPAEVHLARFPQVAADPRAALELIYGEWLVREELGECPDRGEFLARFPQWAARLHEQLALHGALDRPASVTCGEVTLRAGDGAHGQPPAAVAGYEILGELGRGGMGVVYKARHAGLNRIVALKMVLAARHAGAEQLARFRTEAQAIAQLQHPHIVQIHDVGEQDGQPFFALEYLEGGTLAERLRRTPQAARPTAELVQTLARAVHAAHQKGIIHRDLKPANILFQPGESRAAAAGSGPFTGLLPKIADFGLAKQLQTDSGQTASGAVLGTPSYMAPEQAGRRWGEIGPATDVYGLGSILYEMLGGRPPFLGETPLDTLRAALTQDPLPLSGLNASVPRDLETICRKCLDKDARKRYPSALELAEDLERFLSDRPIRARRAGRGERAWRWCRRNPALATATGLALTALLAAVAVSTSFALYQLQAAERLKGTLKEVQTQREQAQDKHRQAQLLASRLALTQGITLFEQGDGGQGILWLARGLELLPEHAESQRASIQLLLGAWSRELFPLASVLDFPDGNVTSVALSPDGKVIVVGGLDKTARLYDAATAKALCPPLYHAWPVLAVAFSPDGKTVLTIAAQAEAWHTPRTPAARSGSALYRWDVATGKPLGEPLVPPGPILAFGRDLKTMLTAGANHSARLWDTATSATIGPPLPHQGRIRTAAFSSDGRMVLTGSEDRMARLWNAQTGQLLGKPLAHRALIRAVAFSPDDTRFVTGSDDNTAQVWDYQGNPVGPPVRHGAPVSAVALSPDGQTLLTGSQDHTARMWEVSTGRPVGPRLQHAGGVSAVTWSPDGQSALTGSYDFRVRLWRLTPVKALALLPHPKAISAAAFSPDGKQLVTASWDSWLRRWDAVTGKPVAKGKFFRHLSSIYAVAYSPDGKVLLTGGRDKTARLWDAGTGKPLQLPPLEHPAEVKAVAFSPDGKTVVTGCLDGKARLWSTATGQPLGRPFGHEYEISTVAFSPNGKTVLTGSWDGTVRLWDSGTGALVGKPLQHQDPVSAAAISPDGKTLVTAGYDRFARFWDTETGTFLRAPLHHLGGIRSVAFSPDGTMFLTGCQDNTARLWDQATGLPLGLPLTHHDHVRTVAFSPDRKTFFTGGLDTTGRLWRLPGPVSGPVENVIAWAQVISGMELDSAGLINWLDGQNWNERRRRLREQNGLPLP
jgi:WD40 repeat protein/tRNA A-37 threonylcarbamoyl transferase component Bud32